MRGRSSWSSKSKAPLLLDLELPPVVLSPFPSLYQGLRLNMVRLHGFRGPGEVVSFGGGANDERVNSRLRTPRAFRPSSMYVAGTLGGDMLFSLWYRRTNRYIQAEREAQKIVQQGMCPSSPPHLPLCLFRPDQTRSA